MNLAKDYPAGYLAGIELFNSGKFWHAHEEWEKAWLASNDPKLRLFFKGIIQTAAALVHWQKGNPRGLHLNWRKARAKLVDLSPHMLGVDLQQLIAYMDHFEAVEGSGLEPPRLEVDPLPPAV
jgi:predicted metal-dependent hydrolase